MSISRDELEKSAGLAYLDIDEQHAPHLIAELNAIMDFIEQLRDVNTQGKTPLSHPIPMHQAVRPDLITESSCLTQLRANAPAFADDVYLVPQVLEGK